MSFLAGRLASTEGAYFLQESKQAVTRIVEKTKPKLPSSSSSNAIQNEAASSSSSADVLPEVLKHSLPPKIFQSSSTPISSSFSTTSKWVLQTDPNKTTSVTSDALNPLRAYVSLPQVTFGPKRWQLPNPENGVLASTANELRHDKYTPVNPEKLKAAAAGLSQIGKAFVAATVLVFGGAVLAFELAASKLELHNGDDIRTKGRRFVQPRFEVVREKLTPIRTWAEGTSKKWHFKDEKLKDKPLIKELSKVFGAKTN